MKVVNIYGRSRLWAEAVLSNLAHTPFFLEDTYIASVEAFHQGIKYEEKQRRLDIFLLWGVKAKGAGAEANKKASGNVYWGASSRAIKWLSKEYFDLYFEALFAKFSQDDEARAALISTGSSRFSHIIPSGEGFDEIEFQETHFCQSLYCIRSFSQGETIDLKESKEALSLTHCKKFPAMKWH